MAFAIGNVADTDAPETRVITDETENTAKQVTGLDCHSRRETERVSCHGNKVVTELLPKGQDVGSDCKKFDDVNAHLKHSAGWNRRNWTGLEKDPRIIVASGDRVNEVNLNLPIFNVASKLFFALMLQTMSRANFQFFSGNLVLNYPGAISNRQTNLQAVSVRLAICSPFTRSDDDGIASGRQRTLNRNRND